MVNNLVTYDQVGHTCMAAVGAGVFLFESEIATVLYWLSVRICR